MEPEKRKAKRKSNDQVRDEEITNDLYMRFDQALTKIVSVKKDCAGTDFKAHKGK